MSIVSIDAEAFLEGVPPGVSRLIVRAAPHGTLGRDGANDVHGGAAASFAAWGPAGRALLAETCARLEGRLRERKVSVLVRPSVEGLVSDIPSCAAFARQWRDGHFGLAVDPAELLAPSMLPRSAEHAQRIGEALIDSGQAGAVILRGPPRDAGPEAGLSLHAAARAIRRAVPVIVTAAHGEAWRRALGAA